MQTKGEIDNSSHKLKDELEPYEIFEIEGEGEGENRKYYEKTKTKMETKKCCCVCGGNGNSCCAKCHGPIYCGKECQRKDWENHKPKCGIKVLIYSPKNERKFDIYYLNEIDITNFSNNKMLENLPIYDSHNCNSRNKIGKIKSTIIENNELWGYIELDKNSDLQKSDSEISLHCCGPEKNPTYLAITPKKVNKHRTFEDYVNLGRRFTPLFSGFETEEEKKEREFRELVQDHYFEEEMNNLKSKIFLMERELAITQAMEKINELKAKMNKLKAKMNEMGKINEIQENQK
jgi:hypothetical protein